MPQYKYETRSAAGGTDAGVIDAGSMAEASALLRGRGGYLLNLAPTSKGAANVMAFLKSVNIEAGPSLKDVMNFTSQLAVMVRAGMNLRAALEGIAEGIKSQKFRGIVMQIKEDVESGKPLSDSLAKNPKVFSHLYVNMVRASELSGSLGHMLDRICTYLSQMVETRSMIRGAMVYPAIIGVMAVSTTIFLLTWVLPKFTALFAGKEDLLPKPTVALIAISAFLRNQWYIPLGAALLVAAGVSYIRRIPRGRLFLDKLKMRVPLFRGMFRALYISRSLHTMGELVNAGVPMLETLKVTADVAGNSLYQRMWQNVHAAVRQGDKIAKPITGQKLLPANVVQMVSAGEESGNLGEVLRDISEYYARELRSTIKTFTAMIEPVMIVLMGFVVGFIAMSIMLPIFGMSKLVK